MQRPTYPTLLRDHLGNEIRLPAKPFATGGEGAVFDVVSRPELVAKLYSKPQSEERCIKLRTMAKLCSPDLLKIAAWPTATLSHGNPSKVDGILMPRIVDYKEIHHLYSVAQRKKDFPEADWGFLLHTARNCAIAFETVHRHGHIVGDVNQKNVMVSKKGIVALVDCDSFQVKDGNRIFRCGVGVPEYTPPELHGRKFSEVDRDQNHDRFGLAVMIFHLLMVGRHPFAGVPLIHDDIPIEKAIQQGLYAYARNPTKLKPPPHVPQVSMLDGRTRDLFERAFRSSQRPTATEWRGVLDESLRGLQRCKSDPKHSYPNAGQCPWCQLIAVSRLMFFIPGQGSVGTILRIEDILNLFQKLSTTNLVFHPYCRPAPNLPVEVALPVGMRAIQKPVMLPSPAPSAPLPDPVLKPLPSPPVPLAAPTLRDLPAAAEIPTAPPLKPHPPAPMELPRPKLHPLPPPPIHPPLPYPTPTDPFLKKLAVAMAAAGVLVYFVAWPMGLIMMIGFGAWWLIMMLTERMRLKMAQESLRATHDLECALMDENYEEHVRPIRRANQKILDRWQSVNTAATAKHAGLCRVIDRENQRRIEAWEATKAAINAEDYRVTQEVIQVNRRVLSDWEATNNARYAAYGRERLEIEQENQRLLSQWNDAMAALEAEHRQQCDEIDSRNQQVLAEWRAANAPWITELTRWRDRQSAAEAEIQRMEQEMVSLRQVCKGKFQGRKADVERVIASHNGTLQDYARELHQAEIDSQQIQLENYLDRCLIRNAKLKGITGDRILSLESFGIETAKDVTILRHQKVPGIGPVLSDRLLSWRTVLSSKFQPQKGLPESEKQRVASRYMPVLLPFKQMIESALNDLETIATAHRAAELEQIKSIATVVQDRAIADAYVQAMKEI